jgi:hypothetical protein
MPEHHLPSSAGLPGHVASTDGLGACCGRCAHWDRAKKRNRSNPDTPIYSQRQWAGW